MSTRQDYTAYTDTDPSGRIAVAANSLTIANLLGTDTAYLYKDFGASFFSGSLEHTFTFICSLNTPGGGFDTIDGGSASVRPTNIIDGGSSSVRPTDIIEGMIAEIYPAIYLWSLTNATTVTGNSLSAIFFGTRRIVQIREVYGGVIRVSNGMVSLDLNTQYWMRVCRDMDTGTYGTLYCYIYSNASMTILVEVITLVLSASVSFEYLFALSNYSTDPGAIFSGLLSVLTLDPHPYSWQNMILYLRILLDEVSPRYFSDTQLGGYINQAIDDIASTTGCIRNIDPATTTPSSRVVAFSGNRVAAVEYVPGAPARSLYLRQILPRQVNHVVVDGTSPQFWYEWGNYVGIEPLPDDAYDLNMYIEDVPSGDMTVLTQIPEIPPAFRPLIILKALEQALEQDKKVSPANQILAIYNNDMAFNMMDKLSNVPDGTLDLRSTDG